MFYWLVAVKISTLNCEGNQMPGPLPVLVRFSQGVLLCVSVMWSFKFVLWRKLFLENWQNQEETCLLSASFWPWFRFWSQSLIQYYTVLLLHLNYRVFNSSWDVLILCVVSQFHSTSDGQIICNYTLFLWLKSQCGVVFTFPPLCLSQKATHKCCCSY